MPGLRRAFTVIELLVVIAIIALLISMLLPAIARARESGRHVLCMSNNRQLGTALAVYLTENRGYFPGDHWEAGRSSVVTWTVRLRRLTQTEAVFDCPSRPSDFRWVPVYNQTSRMHPYGTYVGWRESENVLSAWSAPRCYGYNGWGFEEFLPVSYGLGGHIKHPREYMQDKRVGLNLGDKPYWEPNENSVVYPMDLIVIADSDGSGFWDHSINATSGPPGRTHFANRSVASSGKCNVLFQDSHVGTSTRADVAYIESDPLAAREMKMQRWNIDHKPHPEQW